jgi:hypothetical protein
MGQISLTILNSVISVQYLSEDLMPTRPAPSVTALGVSVGIMNLTGCWFGAMPVCHGNNNRRYYTRSTYLCLSRRWWLSSPT